MYKRKQFCRQTVHETNFAKEGGRSILLSILIRNLLVATIFMEGLLAAGFFSL